MNHDETPPQRRKPNLRSAPKIRQIYWCDFPEDALLPGFWKSRPVLIISKRSNLYGNVTVLPFSTKAQPDNPYAYPVKFPFSGRPSWIICNYITTVSVSRLRQDNKGIIRLSEDDFKKVVALMLQSLPYLNP